MIGLSDNELTSFVNSVSLDDDVLLESIPIVWKAYINRSPLYKEEFIIYFKFERKHILCYLFRTPFSDDNPKGRSLYLGDSKPNVLNPQILNNPPTLEQLKNFIYEFWNFDAPTGFNLIDYGFRETYKKEFAKAGTFSSLLDIYDNVSIDDSEIEELIERESLELVNEFESNSFGYSDIDDNQKSILAHKEYLKQLKYSYLRKRDEKYRDNLAKKHPAWIISYLLNSDSFVDYVWQVEEGEYILICKIKIEEFYRLKVFYYVGGVILIVRAEYNIFDFTGLDWDVTLDRLYLNFHYDKQRMLDFINLLQYSI